MGKRGIDSAGGRRHLSAHMLQSYAYYFFAFAGFFAPRNMGGCLEA
jgi:hypothetical protein